MFDLIEVKSKSISREIMPNCNVNTSKPLHHIDSQRKRNYNYRVWSKMQQHVDWRNVLQWKFAIQRLQWSYRLKYCVSLADKQIGVSEKKLGDNQGYSVNDNRTSARRTVLRHPYSEWKNRPEWGRMQPRKKSCQGKTTANEDPFGTQRYVTDCEN